MDPEERVFNRIPFYDPQSLAFPVRTLVQEKPRRSYTWAVPVKLDQGSEGACVGFGWADEFAAKPNSHPQVTNDLGFDTYRIAQRIDRKEGRVYSEGATVLAGAKAAKELVQISTYRWALGPGAVSAENDLALAVGYLGPAVIGSYWYSGMDYPDANGFIHPTGTVRGGHCYLVNSYSVIKEAYGVWNSWGTGFWGWISKQDMVTLLANDGEACIPTKF